MGPRDDDIDSIILMLFLSVLQSEQGEYNGELTNRLHNILKPYQGMTNIVTTVMYVTL